VRYPNRSRRIRRPGWLVAIWAGSSQFGARLADAPAYGQDVARAIGLEPLKDKDILIGKFTGAAKDIKGSIDTIDQDAFKGKCPLWTYILAETVGEDVVIRQPRATRQSRHASWDRSAVA
jgi:hypothetical protein